MYSPQLLDHFQNPRNVGEVVNPSASAEMENPACGDVLRLSVRTEVGRIEEIRFLAQGCVAAMACASAVTELASGKDLVEVRRLRREAIVEAVGGLPPESSHASYLALDALRALLSKLSS